jgi:hypothetical protein
MSTACQGTNLCCSLLYKYLTNEARVTEKLVRSKREKRISSMEFNQYLRTLEIDLDMYVHDNVFVYVVSNEGQN